MPDGKQEMLKQLAKSPTLNQYVESPAYQNIVS